MNESAGCRILTLSTSTQKARELVHHLRTLANESEPVENSDLEESQIPWTIRNKYYTAEVHFEVRDVEEWEPSLHASGVPAILYVWSQGEEYKERVKELSGQLADHDPDVRLAIELPKTIVAKTDEGADSHDDELEEYLSQYGFEYVDGGQSSQTRAVEHPDDDSGAPGLYRVIDALSTIMWPSMIQSDSARKRRTIRVEDEADSLNALIAQGGEKIIPPGAAVQSRQGSMVEEMAELERWLSEDVPRDAGDMTKNVSVDLGLPQHIDAGGDPWGSTLDASSAKTASTPSAGFSGFDDDFTNFVDGGSSFGAVPIENSYRSLDSVEGEVFQKLSGPEDDDDEDLPSRAEIDLTMKRIFGALQPGSLNPDALDSGGGGFDMDMVFGALQGMKTEIAGLSDEKERRRAAARVALGLVYGLDEEKPEDH